MSTIFADLRIKMRRFRRKDINGFNVVDPAVACVAGTCQRDSQIILQLRLCNRQNNHRGRLIGKMRYYNSKFFFLLILCLFS